MATNELSRVLQASYDGRMVDLRYRQRQLTALHAWLSHYADDLVIATQEDERCTSEEAMLVVTKTLEEIQTHYNSLSLDQHLEDEYCIKNGVDCTQGSYPVGLVYNIPEERTVLYSVMSILSAAIAAGNCCIVEVSVDALRPAAVI